MTGISPCNGGGFGLQAPVAVGCKIGRAICRASALAACLVALFLASTAIAQTGDDPAAPAALGGLAAQGEWRKIIEITAKALDAGKGAAQNAERLRRMDWLIYAYLQTGQDDKAKAVVDMRDLSRLSAGRDLAGDLALEAMPLSYALERDDWSAAASQPVAESAFPQALALAYFGRALGAARGGNLAAARAELAELESLQAQLLARADPHGAARAESELDAAKAWIALAEGRSADALQLMRAAAALEDDSGKSELAGSGLLPMRELLADMLLEGNDAAAALEQYEASLRRAPARLRGYWGAAQAAEKAGNLAKAKSYYGKFASLCHAEDCIRPGLLTAAKRQ
jgi:tetratricopeptide (TPR) repeat protein